MGDTFDGIDIKEIEAVAKTMCSGGTVRDLRGFTDDEMEAMYSLGHNLYVTGQLEKADQVFRYLVFLDHANTKFWFALGAVQQSRRQYDRAASSYAYAAFLDLENPKPLYHAAECFLALGDAEKAESALAAVDQFAPADSPYRAKAKDLASRIKAA